MSHRSLLFLVSVLFIVGASLLFSFSAHTQTSPAPYSGTPISVPGIIQAENFDTGGEGVAYHDTAASNQGGAYRTAESVDIATTPDTGGGYYVGWTEAGEWIKYTVDITVASIYDIGFRIASPTSGGTFHLEVDGVNVTGSLTISSTGGWNTYQTLTKNGVSLASGQHVLQLVMDALDASGNIFDINYITLALVAGGSSDTQAPSTPTSLATTAISSSQINLSWTASTDNVGVTGYRVYRDNVQIATSNSTTYADTGLAANTTYTYAISAYDAAGNGSTATAGVNATTPSGTSSGRTYYVDGSCANNGNGLADQCASSVGGAGAWKDPQTGFTNALAGDTVLFKNGTYITATEGVSNRFGGYTITHSGTSGNPITFKNYPGHTPSFRNCTNVGTTWCNHPTISADSKHDVIIDGLIVHGAIHIFCAGFGSFGTNVVIRNNNLDEGWEFVGDGNWSPLRLENCTGSQIDHNYIHNPLNPSIYGGLARASGIQLFQVRNSITEYNTIENFTASGSAGINDKAQSQNNIHRYNYVHNIGTFCFYVNNQLTGLNISIYGNIGNSCSWTMNIVQGMTTGAVYNNTFYDAAVGLYVNGSGVSGISWYNNIYDDSGRAGGENGNFVSYQATTFLELSDFNRFDTDKNYRINNSASYTSLTSYQAGMSKDLNSSETSCVFVNAAGGDFHTMGACSMAGRVGGVSSGATIAVGAYGVTACVGHTCGTPPPPTGDTTAPTVSITAPTSGTTVSGATTVVSANASDNIGVSGIQFLLDGANLGAEDTTTPYSITWNTTQSTNASHTITARARDAAGNQTTSGGVTVTVNNTTTDTQAPSTPTSLATTAISSSQINLSWTASTDNVGVTGYRVYRDNVQIATSNSTTYADTGLAANTTYTYAISAYDAAGNGSTATAGVNATTPSGTSNECLNWQTLHPAWIWCDDFEDITPLSTKYSYYDSAGGRFVLTTSSTAHDGTHMMSARYDPGVEQSGALWFNFGRNPISSLTRTTEDFTDVYWRMYVKMQSGWQGNPQKLTRARIVANTNWADAATGHLWNGTGLSLAIDPVSGIAADGVTLRTTGYNDILNYTWLGAQSGPTPLFDSAHAGQWQCIEEHMRLNTPGQSNGVSEFWINGNLEASRTNLNWRGSWQLYGINHIAFENWWNGGATPITQSRYWDNLVISTQPIGCGSTPPPTGDTQAPSVSITAPTSGTTVSGTTTTVSANASDNIGVSGVQFLLDGANLGTEDTTSPYSIIWNTTQATNSTHTITARARDAAGNLTTSGGVTVTVNNVTSDTQAPTTPTNLTATAISSSQINLAWTASTDNVGVTGYHIYRNSILLQDVAGATFQDTGLTANTTYVYSISAFDAAGNGSTATAGVSTATQASPDVIAPTVSVSLPASGATVSGAMTAVSANASDNIGVSGVQFLLDGANLGAEDTTTPYSITWNTTQSTNASHTLSARARDAAGNLTTSAGVSVTVNNVTAPLPDTAAPSAPTNLTATPISSNQINLSWTASTDPVVTGRITSGVLGYRIYRNNIEIATTTQTTFSNTGLSPSTLYTYAIASYDNANNGSLATGNVSATTLSAPPPPDTIAPASVTLAATNTTSNQTTLTFTAPGDDGSVGTASFYDIRYSTTPLTLANWDSANQAAGEPTPRIAGTGESFTLANLNPSTTYYISLRSTDDALNLSSLSNVVMVATLNAPTTPPPTTPPPTTGGGTPTVTVVPPSGGGGGGSAPTYVTNPGSTSALTPTLIRDLSQHTSTGLSLPEQGIVVGPTLTIKGYVFTGDGVPARLEVEVKPFASTFNATTTLTSALVSSGTSTAITILTPTAQGLYKFRARTVSQSGTTSPWLEFGSPLIPDFMVLRTAMTPTPRFTKLLKLGMRDAEVSLLQQTLKNLNLYNGLVGGYFGTLTRSSVIAFQKKYGLPPVGQVGPATRIKLNALVGTAPTTSSSFTRPLSLGSRGDDVKLLQTILIQQGFLTGTADGVFGPKTKAAVIRFQERYHLQPPQGFVGPATRAKLGEMGR